MLGSQACTTTQRAKSYLDPFCGYMQGTELHAVIMQQYIYSTQHGIMFQLFWDTVLVCGMPPGTVLMVLFTEVILTRHEITHESNI